MTTQRLTITIDLPANLTEEEFERACNAILLRLLSAQAERRPAALDGLPHEAIVQVGRS